MTKTPAKLRREVLSRIEPPADLTRRARSTARDLMTKLRRLATTRGLRVQPRLVGSLAKDTHLRDPLDVDVFILFPPATPRPTLEKEGIFLGQRVLKKPVLKYAEHPYVHGTANGFAVDVVPAYKLETVAGRLSAVDRSPFHTDFVRRKATSRHRQEIRLLKRFLRGIHCYGAETATGGVSGYLAELLILKYRSLDHAIEAMAKWSEPVQLSLGRRATAMGGPLVFIDPVDATRNAAAAVTPITFARLQRAARAYAQRPAPEFFFPRDAEAADAAHLERLLGARPTVGFRAPPPPGRPETRLPQAQRLATKIRRRLEDEGFLIPHAEAHLLEDGSALLLFEHKPSALPPTYEHRGPREGDTEHGERFRAKWADHPDAAGTPRLDSGRWTVDVRRRQRTPTEILDPLRADLLQGFGYSETAMQEAAVVSGTDLSGPKAHHLPLTLLLERRDPWEW